MKRPGSDPQVMYMAPEKGPFECEHCAFFIADGKPCRKVSTPVESEGCCNLYQPGKRLGLGEMRDGEAD